MKAPCSRFPGDIPVCAFKHTVLKTLCKVKKATEGKAHRHKLMWIFYGCWAQLWADITSVGSSSLYRCCWRHFSTLIAHKELENRQENGKRVPLLTDASETLGQSSPQLFHFADFLRGLGGWHQVAHCVSAADWLWFGAGDGGPAFTQPCGASSAQLQRAGKQETEPQRLSLLSSTSAGAANAFLRFPQECNYISTDTIKVRAEAEASKLETVRNLLRLSAAFAWSGA